jgi:transcriptional regulator with XRE-family HTH domain
MEKSFSQWLDQRLDERGWSRADLSRRSGISEAALSLLYSGAREPGKKMCAGIADALHLNHDDVFRAAGLLPAKPSDDETVSEIMHISHTLTEENRQDVLDYARLRLEKQEKEQSGKRSNKRNQVTQ